MITKEWIAEQKERAQMAESGVAQEVSTKSTVYALVEGKWTSVMRGGQKPDAHIIYAFEPYPEPGRWVWTWFAVDYMGVTESLEAAQRAAETEVEREKGR